MEESLRTDDFLRYLVEKYSDMLMRIAFTHMKSLGDAEDAVQNVFLKYLQKEPTFENEEHEKAWLIKVCINTCRNSLKSFWSRKTTGLNENLYGFSTKEYEVMDAVMRLPVKYRSVILLFYFEDYSITQIAMILHQKESTIGSQLYRARQLLKPMLKEDLDDEKDGF